MGKLTDATHKVKSLIIRLILTLHKIPLLHRVSVVEVTRRMCWSRYRRRVARGTHVEVQR